MAVTSQQASAVSVIFMLSSKLAPIIRLDCICTAFGEGPKARDEENARAKPCAPHSLSLTGPPNTPNSFCRRLTWLVAVQLSNANQAGGSV